MAWTEAVAQPVSGVRPRVPSPESTTNEPGAVASVDASVAPDGFPILENPDCGLPHADAARAAQAPATRRMPGRLPSERSAIDIAVFYPKSPTRSLPRGHVSFADLWLAPVTGCAVATNHCR